MEKTGLLSRAIQSDTRFSETNITSLTVSNHGDTVMTVTQGGVSRTIPAFRDDIGVPFGSFNIPGDGTMSDIEIEISFEGGAGKAIIDYRKVQIKTC